LAIDRGSIIEGKAHGHKGSDRGYPLLKTSRTQVDRLLDPKNDITLSSLQRAAAMVGRPVTIELV
jgi:hypothetical protein